VSGGNLRLYVIYEISLVDNLRLGLDQCFTTHNLCRGLMLFRRISG